MKQKYTACIAMLLIFAASSVSLFAGGTREAVLESSNFFALGTTCNVSIYGGTDDLFTALENIVIDIENRMSVNIENSEVSLVNAAAGIHPVQVSDDVYKVISAGVDFSDISSGAFDISIGPLVKLWDIGGGGNKVPEKESVDAALAFVDYTKVELLPQDTENGARIYLPAAGMALEPGGIAKGFAADAASDYLRNEGVKSALINFGGNVLTIGPKADGSKWRIGIQNPDSSRGDYIGIISVADKAVVTSGKYERFIIGSDGRRYHHILSTENGYPVENGIAQVSIISSDSMTADAMSTTIFSLGLEKGVALAERMNGVDAIIVLENDNVYLTSGLNENFKLTDTEFKIVD